MTLIQKILVGVDLHHGDRHASREISEESQAAVAEAIYLAAVSGSSITFCSVLEISAQCESLMELDHDTICQSVKTVAHDLLVRLVNQAGANGLVADCVVRAHERAVPWVALLVGSGPPRLPTRPPLPR